MPYDYPGEYALRFDGIDAARFKGIGKFVGNVPGSTVPMATMGPGTLELYSLTSTGSRGTVILDGWRGTTARPGRTRDVLIERRDAPARWTVRNARVVGWTTGTGRSPSAEIAVETLTIAHEGILPF